MQKIINSPNLVVDDMLQGYIKCNSNGLIQSENSKRVYVRKDYKNLNKVGIVSGGGSGHFPAFIGYLRPYLLDAVAVGNIFVAPPANDFYEAFRLADFGKGVLCIHGNYKLDNKNVLQAIKMAKNNGINVKRVVANDDVASTKNGDRKSSRGLAGEVFLWKIAGAASDLGMNLDQIVEICERTNGNIRSIGIGLSACVIPEKGIANFDVVEGTMEFGIGHHGDPGMKTYKLRTANEIADIVMAELLDGYFDVGKQEIAVLVSGLGGSTQMELFILFNRIMDVLKKERIKVVRSYVGNYFTSLDMKGASVTLLKLDDELKKLLKYKERFCL